MPPAASPITVALIGFSIFERNALASYFRLAPRSTSLYVHVLDVDEARFIVADADQPGVPDLLNTLGRTGDAVFVGAQVPDNAPAWVMRPIDPAQVLRELDRLLSVRDRPTRELDAQLPADLPQRRVHPAAPDRTVGRSAEASADRSADRSASHLSRRAADGAASDGRHLAERRGDAVARREQRQAALRPVTIRRALLVDDSDVALAYLERQLGRQGLDCDRAMNSSQALELLQKQAYGFAFIDVDLGPQSELDGLALCQQIKRRLAHVGGRAPVVVLASAFNEAVDRVRGTLAGADAQLGKPIDSAALNRLLATHGVHKPDARPTTASPGLPPDAPPPSPPPAPPPI